MKTMFALCKRSTYSMSQQIILCKKNVKYVAVNVGINRKIIIST